MSRLERDALLSDAYRILSKQVLTREDSARVDGLLGTVDRLDAGMQIKRAKTAMNELEVGIRNADNSGATELEKEFRDYLRHGRKERLSLNSQRAMAGAPLMIDAPPEQIERRAQGVGSGPIGGYLAPKSFADRLESSLVAADGLFEVSHQFETPTGSAFTHPLLDDQSPANKATVVAESGVSVAGPDLSFAAGIAWDAVPTWRG